MIPIAKLYDTYSILEGNEANNLYSQGWYGSLIDTNTLKLDPYETVLLFERSRLEVSDSTTILPLANIVASFSNHLPEFVFHYLLYKDLRGRGYIVKKENPRDRYFELYERGASANKDKDNSFALIIPMTEGEYFEIDEIDLIVNNTKKLGKRFIFAVLDSLGDVSYYSVDELEFKKVKK